jgi:4-amino-4-deoxychorismate lyase
VTESLKGAGAPQAAWIDGHDAASVSVIDRGLHYGDGLFETLACPAGRPRLLARHLERLRSGCERLSIECPAPRLLREEIAHLNRSRAPCVMKLMVTRGALTARAYRPSGREKATRILLRYPWPSYDPELARAGVCVRTASVRLGENRSLAGLKHLNRLEQVLAAASLGEFAEALMYSSSGALIGGTMSNVFVVAGGKLLTPQLDRCGVEGVMRATVLELAAGEGIDTEVRPLTAEDLAAASGMFLTNALIGLRPVRSLDERAFAVGDMIAHLQQRLEVHLSAAGEGA